MSQPATEQPTPTEPTPAAPAPAPAAPAPAPAVPAQPAAAKPEEPKLYTAEQVASIVHDRLERAKASDKPDTERISALEEKVAKAERAAVTAIVAKAAATAHDPAIVAKLIDLGDLTSDDAAAIETRVAEFLTANPYLVKTPAAPAPTLTPAPGVASTGGDRKLLTEAELDAISPEELAADEDKLKLYMESRAALRS